MGDLTATPQVREKFAELICADPDWLDAEFASLVTASYGAPPAWPSPPAPPHLPPPGAPRGRRRARPEPTTPSPVALALVTRTTERHQRSPPLSTSPPRPGVPRTGRPRAHACARARGVRTRGGSAPRKRENPDLAA